MTLTLESNALTKLARQFPASTEAERQRFLQASKGNMDSAGSKLREFLEWRVRHNLDAPVQESMTDSQDWEWASCVALNAHGSDARRGQRAPRDTSTLPQIINVYYDDTSDSAKSTTPCLTKDAATLILHVLPAQVNKKRASSETYALAMAIYLDLKLNRNSLSKATIFLDIRPGRNWSNPPAYSIMPFISHVSKTLHAYFPERLHQCVLYPMPNAAIWLWVMAKRFLDQRVVEAVVLIGGSDAMMAEPPKAGLSECLDDEIMERMERRRLELFL